MFDRVLLASGLILLGLAFYLLARSGHLWLVRQRLDRAVRESVPGLGAFRPGRPALLYFTAQNCVPCRTVLKPSLRRLIAEVGDRFQMLEIDAESQTDVTRYWNVLSVPTIFVLDPQGKPRHVHYGVVKMDVLCSELGQWFKPA